MVGGVERTQFFLLTIDHSPLTPSRSAPAPALCFEEVEGGFRPPAPGLVVGEVRLGARRGPLFEDGHDELPAALGHVLARVERRVAEDAVEDQTLVSLGQLDAEG